MTRRCSHCSNNGHNSRTCPSSRGAGAGVKLFGVRLTDGSIIKKSASMGNLNLASTHHHSSPSSSNLAASSPNPSSPCSDPPHEPQGYLSDDPAHISTFANRRGERKKGSHRSISPFLHFFGVNSIWNRNRNLFYLFGLTFFFTLLDFVFIFHSLFVFFEDFSFPALHKCLC